MKKLVILTLDGNFEQGFHTRLEIAVEGYHPFREVKDRSLHLPPLPQMPKVYQQWYVTYRGLDNYRIKPKKAQTTNVRFEELKQECKEHTAIVQQQFLSWLKADPFHQIEIECLNNIDASDEVRLILRTDDPQVRKLPWHLWDLREHRCVEIAVSSPSAPSFDHPNRSQVRILVILGNREGIDTNQDESLLKQYCGEAEMVFLVEPQRQVLNEHLWDRQGWDMLFFSGHSHTEGTTGRIFLNATDSFTIDELSYGLQTAVSQGLQIAFFNSCDGLGIASELETLHIPQIIIMREPVPDRVAQEFLKYFLQDYTNGVSLYQSVGNSRKKLQGLEGEFPCASWLPLIVQDSLSSPPSWRSLGAIANCPYRGLAAFQEADAPYFFGREAVTQKLLTEVKIKPMVASIGASGSGKSSLVFAGLVPQLKHTWQIVTFRPGNNPFEALAIALSTLVPSSRLTELELEITLKQNPQALTNFIDSLSTRVLLIADQFEELYTLCLDPQERQQLLDTLLHAVYHAPAFTLILTLRADFYGDALSYRPLADALQDAHFSIGPMDTVELQAAIEKPAHLFDVTLEAGLTQRMLTGQLPLPLLEFALTQLWSEQRGEKLTHQAYDRIGGVTEALANHAEAIYAQFTPQERE